MTINERFSANVKKLRLTRKLSQEALGRRANVCTSYVSMLERGQRSAPLPTVEAFAIALGVKPARLIS